MHAYIIVGDQQQSLKERLRLCELWHASVYDVVTLDTEDPSIGIALVRQFQHQLILSPYNSPFLVGVIVKAERLTIEAQNALLKLLEEPPPQVKLLLETELPLVLLPTILSRCHVINLSLSPDSSNTKQEKNIHREFELLRTLSPGQRMAYIDKQAITKDDVGQWITDRINALHAMLMNQPSAKITQNIRLCLAVQRHLAANVNPKLVMDMLLLKIT